MRIELSPDEDKLRQEIVERMDKAGKALDEGRMDEEMETTIDEAGERSHQLHMLLKARGHEPKHHAYMIENRGMPADHREFYQHIHPIEDLLKFIDDEHANDDPVDQTVGSVFEFRVYSRRWGHEDIYRVKRTKDGWDIAHPPIGGACDKGGQPFLFRNLQQDSIQFPAKLSGWMEWLWDQAKAEGLTEGQVQTALQELADWVSETERTAPDGGIWAGY